MGARSREETAPAIDATYGKEGEGEVARLPSFLAFPPGLLLSEPTRSQLAGKCSLAGPSPSEVGHSGVEVGRG